MANKNWHTSKPLHPLKNYTACKNTGNPFFEMFWFLLLKYFFGCSAIPYPQNYDKSLSIHILHCTQRENQIVHRLLIVLPDPKRLYVHTTQRAGWLRLTFGAFTENLTGKEFPLRANTHSYCQKDLPLSSERRNIKINFIKYIE